MPSGPEDTRAPAGRAVALNGRQGRWALNIAIVALVASLAACGSSGKSKASTTKTSPTPRTNSAAPGAYLGQITLFGGNFAPVGWHICDGSTLPIEQNQTLFSVLGTRYGGDGKTTVGLPGALPFLSQESGAPDITCIISTAGVFPAKDGRQAVVPYIGEMTLFGGTVAPAGWHLCDGSTLPISTNQVLFSVLGTRFGGDGQTSFGLPSIRTSDVNSDCMIATQGVYPAQGSGYGDGYLAEIGLFGGNVAPAGWHLCDGSTLSVNLNQALFSLLGSKYGGDGRLSFRLPGPLPLLSNITCMIATKGVFPPRS